MVVSVIFGLILLRYEFKSYGYTEKKGIKYYIKEFGPIILALVVITIVLALVDIYF